MLSENYIPVENLYTNAKLVITKVSFLKCFEGRSYKSVSLKDPFQIYAIKADLNKRLNFILQNWKLHSLHEAFAAFPFSSAQVENYPD